MTAELLPGVLLLLIGAVAIASFIAPKLAVLLFFTATVSTGLFFRFTDATIRPEMVAAVPLIAAAIALKPVALRMRPHDVPFILWLAVLLFSSAFLAPDPGKSVWISAQILLSFAVYLFLRDSQEMAKIAIRGGSFILASICFISVLSFLLFLAGISVPTAMADLISNGRIIGLAFEVNLFASQCALWLVLMWCRRDLLHDRPNLFGTCAAIIFVGVILAATRAAWVVLLLLILVAAWRTRNVVVKVAFVLGTVSAIAALVLSGTFSSTSRQNRDTFASRIFGLFDFGSGTGKYRIDIYQQAIDDFKNPAKFLFGTGANSFSQFHEADATNTGPPYLSSIWLAIPYDAGLLGAALFVWGMVAICRANRKTRQRLSLFLVCALLCASTTNIVWFAFPWMCIAILSTPSHSRAANSLTRSNAPAEPRLTEQVGNNS